MGDIILKSIGVTPFLFCDLKLPHITPPTYKTFCDFLFKGFSRMGSLPAAPAAKFGRPAWIPFNYGRLRRLVRFGPSILYD